MSSFEQIGINRQYEARTIDEANKSFKRSCECCCTKGRHIECDRCQIAYVHSLICAFFNDANNNANQK